MKWITRANAKVDRVACPWLIRRFIDPDAEFLFVPAEQVLATAEAEQALSYDAPGARYTHRDGKCTFEVLMDEYELTDPALKRLARIVHGADVTNDLWDAAEAPGLKALAHGFAMTTADDHVKIAQESAMYDALYAWCQAKASHAAAAAAATPNW
ncbi:MAG TPA: chromate resistance protein ChrB domain-containing protein [Candidatus Eisenbacteria bacterium]|nr:chromate resistance protein ChrB domain-containing protein [Candidatus Eisenbacteria bacterium]